MKHKHPDFLYGNMSDVGKVRSENQDYYGRYEGDFGCLIIVCDGMGGYEGGAVASRLAVESIYEHFKRIGGHYDPRNELAQALIFAQKNILDYVMEHPETKGMGTTAVILLIRETSYWFANLGDSRLYLKRGGSATQLTRDHSLVQDMVDSGILTDAQAADHPKRNIITRALGTDNFTPDLSGPFTLNKSDVFMLCSDGLYHYFTLREMESILDLEPQSACEAFVEQANQQGSDDNVTVQIVKSNIGDKAKRPAKEFRGVSWIAILGVSVLLLLAASIYLAHSVFKIIKPPVKTERSAKATNGSSLKIETETNEIGSEGSDSTKTTHQALKKEESDAQ
ncbi:MAG: protein phosphatase 2C domain-containing protein [Candidatus Cloacimonadaceae bacterium]|nr:protein phosphatase 2C domain-containing protein [Candidatus Cloacimonadaceae bacterium]MDP3114965.1 protein phosphatase 2C domain-containing protein [Candidatus Cloacimonadaceae bacterium]